MQQGCPESVVRNEQEVYPPVRLVTRQFPSSQKDSCAVVAQIVGDDTVLLQSIDKTVRRGQSLGFDFRRVGNDHVRVSAIGGTSPERPLCVHVKLGIKLVSSVFYDIQKLLHFVARDPFLEVVKELESDPLLIIEIGAVPEVVQSAHSFCVPCRRNVGTAPVHFLKELKHLLLRVVLQV